MKNAFLFASLLTLLAGCSYVQLSKGGAGVAQLNPEDANHCKAVGTVTAQTRDKVVMQRKLEKVREELTVLARNEAAALGANAIVPLGEIEQGSQRFQAYSCQRSSNSP